MADMRPRGKSVEEIISKLDPEKKKLANRLRQIVKKTLPDAIETVKWRNITYLHKEQDLAWIIVYGDHLDFGFFKGAMLKSDRLEGTGKGLRHIKVRNEEDIDEPEFSRLLKDATKLES